MNILFLSELFYPHGSGAELATYLYSRLLSETGNNVIVVTNRFVGEKELSRKKNLTIYRFPLLEGTGNIKYSILKRVDVLFSRHLMKLVKHADVVYVPRFWYSGILLAKKYRKPVVVHLHDYIPICPLCTLYDVSKGKTCYGRGFLCSAKCIYGFEKTQARGLTEAICSTALNSIFGFLWGKLVQSCDALVCVSEAHRRFIVQKAGTLLRSKIHVIYNPLPEVKLGEIKGDEFGYFGGLSPLKGFRILFEAVKHINSSCGKVIDVHMTNFPSGMRRFSDALHQNGFETYGRLQEEQFEKLYERIRCVVVPSLWPETFSYAVIEAILRGRLVIASSVGAIPEVTTGCRAAFLFPAGNTERLVDKLLYVSGLSRAEVVDSGIQSREFVRRRFDNEKTIGRFMGLLNDVSSDVA